MSTRIQSVNFEASEQLKAFIQKKIAKLAQYDDKTLTKDVYLKVVKPETVENKNAEIKINSSQLGELFAEKTTDTFEQSIDECVEALIRQIKKHKEKIKANKKFIIFDLSNHFYYYNNYSATLVLRKNELSVI